MATFVLVPGAGGVAWYWHRVVPLLEEAKHAAIAVDLPPRDPCRTVAGRFHRGAGVRTGPRSQVGVRQPERFLRDP